MDFNLSHANFRTIMLYPSDELDAATNVFQLSVYKRASPYGLLFLNELTQDVLFDELIFGDYMRCHWCVTTNQFRMEDGNGLQAFRQHMFQSYHLSPPKAWSVRAPSERLRGIVVWNKRFTKDDMSVLSVFLSRVNNETSVGQLTFDWMHWSDYTFERQLSVLSETFIYVSGPGTAIMNQPFLPDGAAIIALGTYNAWEFQKHWYSPWFLDERQMAMHPGYMEQFMSAGVDYTHTLYYPLCDQLKRKQMGSLLDADILLDLVRDALQWISSNHAEHAEDYRVNLSPDGKVVDELLKRDETFRAYYRDDKHHHDCGHSAFQWPEMVVRRQGGWAEDSPFFFHKCKLNTSILEAIKVEQDFADEC